MSNSYFKIQHLTYRYEDGTTALKDVNLCIKKGKKIALLGSNGAGKSTLFLHLNGLLKPSSGEIYFEDQLLHYSRKQLIELRSKVGIVFQNPETQLFNGTVKDDISYGPMNLNLSEEEREHLIHQAIEQTEVEGLLEKPIHFLSLGQKKRVSIAGVLAMDPNVIILDEPTAALDAYYTERILQLLKKLHSEERTIILSTHNIEFAFEWADEAIVIHDGEILYQGNLMDLFEHHMEIVEKANIGVPWSIKIGTLLKSKGLINNLQQTKSNEKTMQIVEQLLDLKSEYS